MGTSLVVHSQIKKLAVVESKALNISSDFYTTLNNKVEHLIADACRRAKENNRNTVMGRDV